MFKGSEALQKVDALTTRVEMIEKRLFHDKCESKSPGQNDAMNQAGIAGQAGKAETSSYSDGRLTQSLVEQNGVMLRYVNDLRTENAKLRHSVALILEYIGREEYTEPAVPARRALREVQG